MIPASPRQNSFGSANQQGLTLVEILVTTVIISVGLLGIAALHLTSLRNGYDSNSRSRATWFANDIADRIRANQANAKLGTYTIALGASVSSSDATTANDLTQWKSELASMHGDGSISAPVTVGNDTMITITIVWEERGGYNSSASSSSSSSSSTSGTSTSLTTQIGI